MIAIENGIGKGSARSIASFDVFEAIRSCEGYLDGYGGHKYAAGLTIQQDSIEGFRKAFQQTASETLCEEDFVQSIQVDADISLSEVSDRMVRLLKQFGPFGPKNMRPLFLSRNVEVVGTPRIVGKNHLKFRVRQGQSLFDAIGFGLGDLFYRVEGNRQLDLVYVIEENVWNGVTRIQFRVKDLR
jgi:single-stranded-DNA-specific exonuclease